MKKKNVLILVLVFILSFTAVIGASCGKKETKEDEIVIGVSPSPSCGHCQAGCGRSAKRWCQSYYKEYSDYVQPNIDLAEKRLMPISFSIFRILRSLLPSAI